jgi:hypothetical protein
MSLQDVPASAGPGVPASVNLGTAMMGRVTLQSQRDVALVGQTTIT